MFDRAMILGVILVAGCGISGSSRKGDGALCEMNEECGSGYCTSARLCAHSGCECAGSTCGAMGAESRDCADGWLCLDHESLFDPVEEFFGGEPSENDGYCQPLCSATCPEHYVCDGMFCRPLEGWVNPVPTIAWSGEASGMIMGGGEMMTVRVPDGSSIMLEASATSPLDVEIAAYEWVHVSGAGDYMNATGTTLDITIENNYRRAELTVRDAEGHSAMGTVIFETCIGAGDDCGYENRGCCNECNPTTMKCM